MHLLGRRILAEQRKVRAGACQVEGDRATGVEVESGGEVQQVYGRRITLSAGAVASPAILLRSGVGPADDLTGLGIGVVTDLPVGRRVRLCSRGAAAWNATWRAASPRSDERWCS